MPTLSFTVVLAALAFFPPAVRAPETPLEPAAAVSDRLDALFERGWTERGIRPSPRADDATFLRRLSLAVRGTIPTEDEARAFVAEPSPAKDAAWIDAFLDSPDHARYLARIVTDTLVGVEYAPGYRPGVLRLWLEESFRSRRPWDEIVEDLLTGQHPREWYGPTNFVVRWSSSPEELAGATSRLFLGEQIQCAQCHDHPTAPVTRENFYSFAAFFADLKREHVDIQLMGLSAESGRNAFVCKTVPGREIVFDPATSEYGLRGGEKSDEAAASAKGDAAPEPMKMIDRATGDGDRDAPRVVRPHFRGGPPIADDASGRNRQQVLAGLLRSEGRRPMARALANRAVSWAFGRGFVNPVDDFTRSNPPSHPEALDLLTEDLLRSGFDVRRLERILFGTRAFRLASGGSDGPDAAIATAAFARFPVRQMNAHQFFDSVVRATGATFPRDATADAEYATIARLGAVWRAKSTGPLSRPSELLDAVDPERRAKMVAAGWSVPIGLLDPTRLDPVEARRGAFQKSLRCEDPPPQEGAEGCERTIQQVLVVFNGDLVNACLAESSGAAGGLAQRLVALEAARGRRAAIESAYVATLGRAPTSEESASVERALAAGGAGGTRAALADLAWALLNSAEFGHDH